MERRPQLRGHAMLYVTFPDRATARRISRAVLEKRLAAGANVFPAESMYRWQGRVEERKEVVVVFKTRRVLLVRLIGLVKGLHPYEVPCIISCPIGLAHDGYLAWIDRETAAQR